MSAPAPTLEFWYEFASTYSYLTSQRIEAAAERVGVEIQWRPFLLGPVFAAQGWNDSPFNIYPAKGRYMWRDLERLCELYGLAWKRPSAFPRNGLHAARVALVAAEEGWGGPLTRRVFRANFAQDSDIADPGVLQALIAELGQDPRRVMQAAACEANKARLKRRTEEAMQAGIFGAPSFRAGTELFWGDDRLEQALAWVTKRQGVG